MDNQKFDDAANLINEKIYPFYTRVTKKELGLIRIPFGKYKGYILDEVAKRDKRYLEFSMKYNKNKQKDMIFNKILNRFITSLY